MTARRAEPFALYRVYSEKDFLRLLEHQSECGGAGADTAAIEHPRRHKTCSAGAVRTAASLRRAAPVAGAALMTGAAGAMAALVTRAVPESRTAAHHVAGGRAAGAAHRGQPTRNVTGGAAAARTSRPLLVARTDHHSAGTRTASASRGASVADPSLARAQAVDRAPARPTLRATTASAITVSPTAAPRPDASTRASLRADFTFER